jgi:hypothetical protein
MRYFFVFILLFLFIFSKNVYAQEFHVSIEPTVIQIDSTPPSKFQAPFRIKNLSNSSIKLGLKIIPIEARDDGKINLLLNEEDNLASVIRERLIILDGQTQIKELELRGGETKDLILFMDVIKRDPAGDFYFSLVFTSDGVVIDETSTSSIPAGIAMNVLVSIGPKVSATAIIEDFSTNKIAGAGPVFFNLKLKNTGRHLIQPEGNVTIKNMFGKKVADIKILPQYVLAESLRYLIDSTQASPSAQTSDILSRKKQDNPVVIWGEKFLLGFYTAEAKLYLEDNGAEVIKRITFFAIPVQILVIVSGIVFVILGILLRIGIKLRKKTFV